jgi:hypothetical protein
MLSWIARDNFNFAWPSLERGSGDWETRVLDSWKYTIHPVVPTQGKDPRFPSAAMTFNGVNAMLLWILFWMAQLVVLQTLDKVLALDSPRRVGVCAGACPRSLILSTPQYQAMTRASQTEAQGQGGATEVISCVFAMRSLFIMSQTPGLSRRKAAWISKQLEHMKLVWVKLLCGRRSYGRLWAKHYKGWNDGRRCVRDVKFWGLGSDPIATKVMSLR